jgi:hypothetical protein
MLFDKLNKDIIQKLKSFKESGNDFWIVKVKLKNGEIYSNVYITTDFSFGFPDIITFKKSDVIDIKWNGYKKSNNYNPIKIDETEFIGEDEKILRFENYQDIIDFAKSCLINFHKNGKENLYFDILNVLYSGESDNERLLGLRIIFNKIINEHKDLPFALKHSIEKSIKSIEEKVKQA